MASLTSSRALVEILRRAAEVVSDRQYDELKFLAFERTPPPSVAPEAAGRTYRYISGGGLDGAMEVVGGG